MLDESTVRTLASWRGEPVVTSFYLDVDGERYPRPSDYAPHLRALFRTARQHAAHHGDRAAEAVNKELAQISDWLDNDLDRHVTRGVAAFCAPGLFKAIGLPVPVRDQVTVAARADVAQLCQVLDFPPVLVVAMDSQASRMLRMDLDGTHEIAAPLDPVERQADTDVELGSFEHRNEELRREHLRRVAHDVMAELEARPVGVVVLSGAPEALAEFEPHLGHQAVALVAGRMNLGPHASEREFATSAERLVERQRMEHQRATVQELVERASEGEAAVTGLAATLEVLGAAQAQVLIVEEGLEMPGGRCRECSQLVAEGPTCPRCGGGVIAVDNVVAEAISDAFVHHVTLEFCERGSLADVGHIGAFERL